MIVNEGENSGRTGNYLLAAGIVSYGIGPPLVHLAHGNPGEAAGSLVLHAVGPIALALVGSVLGSAFENKRCELLCVPALGVIAFFAGVVAAPVIDAGMLAYDEVPVSFD